jgi:hypothetical protein
MTILHKGRLSGVLVVIPHKSKPTTTILRKNKTEYRLKS